MQYSIAINVRHIQRVRRLAVFWLLHLESRERMCFFECACF